MSKLLRAQVALLLVLLFTAIGVRIFVLNKPDSSPHPEDSVLETQDAAVMAPAVTQPSETTGNAAPTRPAMQISPSFPDVQLLGTNGFAFDLENQQLLYCKGGLDAKIYPASTTKLFSTFIALQYLDPETVITAGDELELVAEGSSLAYIQQGHQLTVAMLVEGMLLPSGNDAAHILAAAAGRAISGDPNLSAQEAVACFVAQMNASAQALGMTGTHFCNPDGFHDENHYTTCRDLITIGRLTLENDTIRSFVGLKEDHVRFASGENILWRNTNLLLHPDSEYYCPAAVGLKTGYTGEAGNCLMSAFEVDGRYVIIGVFGCPEHNDRFVDALTLYDALFDTE